MSTVNLQEARREAFEKIEPHISKTEEKILQGLLDFNNEFGYYPVYTELADYIKIKPQSCNARLVKLRRKLGYVIDYKDPKSRGLGTIQILTKSGRARLKEVSNDN